MYTDGVIEAPDAAAEEFGAARLKEFVEANAKLPAGEFCDALVNRLAAWCGRATASDAHDDLTLVVIDFVD